LRSHGLLPSMNYEMQSLEEGVQEQSIDPIAILAGLLRHWKLIIAIPVLTFIAAYGFLKTIPSQYKSAVDILIFDPQRQLGDGVRGQVSPLDIDEIAINTETQVLKSKSVAEEVVKELSLDKDKEFRPKPPSNLPPWLDRFGLGAGIQTLIEKLGISQVENSADDLLPDQIDRVTETLRNHIDVERVPLSYVLSVSVTSQNPVKAQRLAETVAQAYLVSQREARVEALQRAASWLRSRVDDLRDRILETDASIAKLKAASGLGDTGDKGTLNEQQISNLNSQLMLVRADVAEKRAALDQAQRASDKGEVQSVPQVMSSGVISQLRVQQLGLSQRETELRARLGDRHAEVIATDAELAAINKAINDEADRILANMKNVYDAAKLREQSLEASLRSLTATGGNSADYVKLQQMKRVAEADRQLYANYSSQLNEILARQTLEDSGARIITPATLPDAPTYPRRALICAFAGAFGAIVGLMIAFLLEYFRPGVRTGAEIERTFGYPLVGSLPCVPLEKLSVRAERVKIANPLADAPLFQLTEAVQAVRIGLSLANSERMPKVVLITSAIPGEGKSATAKLLATSGAAAGLRTVLVDGDMRHQTISEAFGKKNQGLSELLTGSAQIADVVFKDPATNIHVIAAGLPTRSPADLLASAGMHNLIVQLREHYDLVVIDASPVLAVIDALALAKIADKILMVVEWSRTPRAAVAQAFKVLRPEAHRVAGIVLNKVDYKQLQPYYGYTGAYHYHGLARGDGGA
jgi:polysaccharide biosynthesis transport protein